MNQDDYIQNKIYIINHIKDKFIFLKSNIETIDIISKLNRNLSKSKNIFTNVTDEEKDILDKYYKNSAVSSGSRIERLRLEAINSEKRCKNDASKCYGRYPNAASKRYGYKELFNENHKEINCPQFSARRRVLGNKNQNDC